MKVPYFYLEAGNIKYFQPQNNWLGHEEELFRGEEVLIRVVGSPEFTGNTLYLNGSKSILNFNIVQFHDERFLAAIKEINSRPVINYDDIPF